MTGSDVSTADFLVGVAELGAALVVSTWLVVHVALPVGFLIADRLNDVRRISGMSER